MPNEQPTPATWDHFWDKTGLSAEDDRRIIREEGASVRWRRLESLLRAHVPQWDGLRTIELGSGRGEVSVLFAQRGAHVTLMDQSAEGIASAKRLYVHMDCKATYLTGDLFTDLKPLTAKFDVALSFGLAEHFRDSQRVEVIRFHGRVVRPGGWVVVQVPNAWCWPYRIFMKLAQWTGHWKVGYEQPYTRRELWHAATQAGLEPVAILGGSTIRDAMDFLFLRIAEHLAGDRFRVNRQWLEIPSPLDRWFSYTLMLVARVPEQT